MSNRKAKGLRLTLGGAPNTPHQIADLPGFYTPGQVTPIGGPGEPTLEQAEAAAKAKGVPVEIVDLSEKEVDEARVSQGEIQAQHRHGVLSLRKRAEGAEVARVRDDIAALAGSTSEEGGR